MNKRIFSTVGAIISWFAVIAQLHLMIENRLADIGETLIRFFSFFTILSNLLVAIYYTSKLFNNSNIIKMFFQRSGVLTAIAVYITIVGLIYQVLLRHVWEPTGLQMLVDELLHSFIPFEFIIYWLLYEDKKSLKWKYIGKWLLFPLLYAICILVRGSFSDFYPYPFIDVSKLGYDKALINTLGLFFVFFVFSALYIGIAKLLVKKEVKI